MSARDPLPPDLARLRVIETHLQLQLEVVRERIADLEGAAAAAEPAAAAVTEAPAEDWLVEHRRTPQGPRPYVVHHPRCFGVGGAPRVDRITREQAAAGLAAGGGLVPCALCAPEQELGASTDR
ncbi:DUF6233 domain-containing protein [Streptomyces longispororuber]|uniref:DUF6233 domain-containing protein n=1 Tax=Streptomyces longispororuber TaxID=68230 RepID=UPI0033CA0557